MRQAINTWYLLARYFNERLLCRASVSLYKDNFLLKGGSLLYAMNGLEARPTVDVGLWRTGSVVAGISWLVYSKKSWVSYAMKMGCHLTQEVSK
ncbi:nucleotidyl transferase AbiEii/AbiGii toxin family protein [Parabacteroides distasonis]|uniref:nucleotidyl transferase AbiEii/AbiGii toxin family protein n=2 Tax=Bacteroidia TaxID=200643 RepID=UPI0020CAC75A|nr:nucleotidyl transferase AbiEii/AbiGii toxin family protein [Parabacteroides distasonis]UVQ79655.1 nucleotidyl transferase AbiEii/AbiGii toxin family protein [Parabacteroides distasonis]